MSEKAITRADFVVHSGVTKVLLSIGHNVVGETSFKNVSTQARKIHSGFRRPNLSYELEELSFHLSLSSLNSVFAKFRVGYTQDSAPQTPSYCVNLSTHTSIVNVTKASGSISIV